VTEVFTMWRSTRMVVLTAITAALYAATLVAFKFVPILPGVTEVRPGVAFIVLCSLLFGPAAAWGGAFGNTIGDLAGGLGPGTAVGFFANFLFGLLPYRFARAVGALDPLPLTPARFLAFAGAAAAGSLACGLTVGIGIQALGLWNIAFLYLANLVSAHNVVVSLLLGTFLLRAILPRAAALGLRWTDIMGIAPAGPSHARRAAAILALVSLGAALLLGNLSEMGYLGKPAPHILVAAGVPLALGVALLLVPEATRRKDEMNEETRKPGSFPPGFLASSFSSSGATRDAAAPGLAFSLEGMRFRYRGTPEGAPPALDGVDLSLEEGRFLAVVGPTGAGKTTITRVLSGIVPGFLSGDLLGRVRGVAARDVGLVFEDFEAQLFTTETTLEVAFGAESRGVPREEIARRVADALRRVGLSGFEGRSPAALSGGEKQRLAIAAVLAQEPRVIALDEPTTDLDPVGKAAVLETLRALRSEGRTVLLVEHETEELAHADRVALVAGGRVVREGPARLVLADAALLEAHGVRPPEIPRLFARLGLDAKEAPIDDDAEAARMLAEAGWRAAPLAPPGASGDAGGSQVVLSVKGVRHVYEGRSVPALDEVGLEVREGEMLAILGANGSGKSTLARVLAGMVAPAAGSVVGADPRAVGFVFQNPDHQIFCATVAEEVAFGPRNQGLSEEEIARRVARALDTVGLTGADAKDPFALPKSDRQRLALASVLAMETRVILMDEPTTGLDHRDQRRMMDLLALLNRRGHTVIVITHHIWIALEYARRIVLMAGGRKIADGPVRLVMRDAAALEKARVRLPPLARLGLRMGVAVRTLDEAAAALERRGEA